MAKALAESGIFVASIDFRMPPVAAHPGSIQDINLAIRWLKANAREFKSRPEWVGSWATSSGTPGAARGDARFEPDLFRSPWAGRC